ncbi:ATL39, partial [Symbiodinium sp. CCMP2456]
MLECIRTGQPCQANVVYTDTPEDIGMLKTAWSAFAVQGGLTVVAGGSAKHVEKLFLTRLRLTRRKSAPHIEDVGLLALGSNSPWIQPPKVVSQSRITTVQRMTVRISVPSHYRCLYKDVQKDCVKDVLADLAFTAGVRSHQLTGGRWEQQDYGKRGHHLLGWLRLPEASARALIRQSGARGIFVTEQTSDGVHVEHTWLARHDKESDEDYKARVDLVASQRSQGIVCRKGGASDLGFIAVATDRAPDKPVVLELSGLPKDWQEEELTQLLNLEGWTQVPRSLGLPNVAMWSHKSLPMGPSVNGLAESDMDVAEQAAMREPQQPPPYREPGSLQEALDAGWQPIDAGGDGDCGYSAIADALHRQKHAHSLSPDECRAEAAWLRTIMVSHIEKHHDRFESVLVKDKNAAPEDPTPYMSIKSWISEAAKPGTWIDGLALQAIAEKKGVPLVIFKRDAETIKRFTLAPKFKQGMAMVAKHAYPVCLILENSHYTYLQPPVGAVFPQAWLRENMAGHYTVLRGAGGDCWSEATPSVHTFVGRRSQASLSEATPSVYSFAKARDPESTPSVHTLAAHRRDTDCSVVGRKTTSKTCYPSQGAGTGWLPWWSCDQPNCSFKVMRHPIVRGHHEARRYHLTKVHGIEKVPRLHDEGPTTKRRRTKKEEALATQAKIEGVRARQRGNNNTAGPDPWWRCDWPDCSFSLEQDAPNKTYRRQQHLKQVHGLKQVPDLRTVGGLASLPVRQTAADSVFDNRWQLTHANFLKKIWKTAHRIECEPCSYRPFKSSTGLPKTRAAHRCELCGIEVQRGEVPLSICKMAKGKPPPLAKRKQIWKECRVAASKELGCKRTLRKERKKGVKSVKGKGKVLLEQATAEGVHLVAMQEVNLTQQGIPSASHAAAALGWQQPLGLVELSRSQRNEAQSLSAHLLGLQAPLQVTSVYSVPGADSTLLYQETQRAEALSGSPWLLALDGNVPMESGPWAAALQLAGGVLRAVGRHVSSRYAIDGLWSLEAVPALEGSVAERPREGDHTLVECAFDLRVPKGGSEWRLARTPEDKREAETDLDAAWQQWCQDSQAQLEAILKAKQREALTKWKEDIHTVRGLYPQGWRCEMEGRFPSSLSHWRVVFIPKKRKGKIATLGDVRPVAIGGGLKGQDAETLVASFHLDFPPESWGHGVMLDYAKAFDATDWQLCTEMLRQMALPEPVVRLLEDQWSRHSRWLSFGGAATTPLRGARGLPQGDPWSPVCLALLLSLPAQQVEREVPEAATLLFADDRTVIAQSLGALQRAKDSWTNLET